MKTIQLLLYYFVVLSLYGQQSSGKPTSQVGRGVSPIGSSARISSGPTPAKNTYAVVVGISDYQDKDIPDLRFADKDAKAFANFLRSPIGGQLDADHLKILTNEQATAGQIALALDWLVEVVKAGENAIIYFSGHGDVESKRLAQPGYLLGWDAPARVYMAGGAVNIRDLQDIVSTLSVQNRARVVVITDACRSGKLSGSDINGPQLTGQNLAKQFSNEIKILSCQPNEYSIEGEQWGGGRGAFSYHLLDALYGLADANNDSTVSLQEVGRYLEDHVTAEVAPVSQVPMVVGDRSEGIATVELGLVNDLRSGKVNQNIVLSPIDSRGLEEAVLAGVSPSLVELYRSFQQALQEKSYFEPANGKTPSGKNANSYYDRLIAEPGLQRLHTIMRRNFAAALQDDAQQTLNEWLKTGQEPTLAPGGSTRLPQKLFSEKVSAFPRCLDRAAELLGNKHYLYPVLMARKLFFEGYLLANSNRNPNVEVAETVLSNFRQSLHWQPDQPHVYWQMSNVFGVNLSQPDSVEQYARRAMELHPKWIMPCTDAAWLLSGKFNLAVRAKPFLEQAWRIDSNSVAVLRAQAQFIFAQQNSSEAETMYKKAIALDPTLAAAWNSLGVLYSQTNRPTEAEPMFRKALLIDSTFVPAWNNLGFLYVNLARYREAEGTLKIATALDSNFATPYKLLGMVYFKTNRPLQARRNFLRALQLNPNYAGALLGMAYLITAEGKTEEAPEKSGQAIGYVEQAIGKGASLEQLEKDEDLAPLQVTPEWKTVMKKHFPDQFKD